MGVRHLLGTSLLLTNRVVPAMFLLLLFGAAYGIWSDPTLLAALRQVHLEPRVPTFALSSVTSVSRLSSALEPTGSTRRACFAFRPPNWLGITAMRPDAARAPAFSD